MFPVHQFDSHPYQMKSAPHHYPSFETIPPQIRAPPDRLYYQSWPCGSNYAYSYPAQFHGCCENHHFPGCHVLRSPYAQPPLPYCHGNYPVPPGVYPIHYIPPHHTMELPRYECDKSMGGYHHCCGYPNHPCNRKGGKDVNIGEMSPRSENKVDESLVPFNVRNYPDPLVWYSPSNIKTEVGEKTNDPQYEKQEHSSQSAKTHYPYPVLWFPSNQIVNKENSKSNESMYEKQEDDSSTTKTNYPYPILRFPPNMALDEKQAGASNGSKTREISKASEQQVDFANGWFPFDNNNLRPSKSRLPGQQIQQQDDDKHGFPCPVFWMPYKPDEKESKYHEGTNVDQEREQITPSHFEISPDLVPAPEGNNNSEMTDEIIGHKGPREIVKSNIQKTIPVKQAEPCEGEKNEEKAKSCEMPCLEAGKVSENGGKRKSPSPTKSSKLPPVCLRVDPLPKKKNANGSSRSPSPPSGKGISNNVSGENVKPAISLDSKGIPQPGIPPSREAMAVRDEDKEQRRSKIKTILVSEGTGSQPGNSELPNSFPEGLLASQPKYKPRDAVDDLSASYDKCKSVTGANSEGAVEDISTHLKSCQIDENEEKSKAEEKPDTIVKVPKTINLLETEAACIIQSAYRGYEVRRWEPLKKLKQIMEVSKRVAELKNSIQAFESSPDIQDDKWRIVIGETIMNLLLKLDTIQGMHPSIRDVRKSVAKELVGLQEKVDHLIQKKVETITQQASPVLTGEHTERKYDLCIRKGQEDEKQEHENSPLETDPVIECHQEVTNSEIWDTPEKAKDDRDNSLKSMEEANATETKLQNSDPGLDSFTNSQNPDMPSVVTGEGENTLEPTSEVSSAEMELEKSVVFPQVGDPEIDRALKGTRLLENKVSEAPEGEVLNEFPKGVLDENTDILDNFIVKNNECADEVLAERDLESKELAQLPQGVLDDNNSESNLHLLVEEEEEKDKTNAVTVDANAKGADGRGPDTNQVESRHEMTIMMPVTSEANESLGGAEDEETNAELLKMSNHRSEHLVQALEEEASVKSKAVDEPEVVHGKEQTGSKAEVFNDPSEVSGYYAAENEIPAVTTTTESKSKEISETSEEEAPKFSFLESETAYVSGGENRPTDSKNSSNKDAFQECDLPVKLSKSCDVKQEENQLNDNFELQASGVAGIDGTFAQTCNAGALNGEHPDHREHDPLKDKQTDEQEFSLSPPSASQTSLESDVFSDGDKKLIEGNMRLREIMQKLMEAGQEQLTAISNLASRVKDLEKRIYKKKKLKMRRNGTSRPLSGSSCLKQSNGPQKEKAVALVM